MLPIPRNDFDSVDTSKQNCSANEENRVQETCAQQSPCGSLSDSGHGSCSDDDEGVAFPHLKRLMFDGNPITDWNQVAKLGTKFAYVFDVNF